MTVHLSQSWIDRLCELPESGMGYQNARVRLVNGDVFDVTIFNADQFEPPAGHPDFDVRDIVDITVVPDSRSREETT